MNTMKIKGLKILAVSAVLSLSMTASVFAGSLALRYSGKNRTYTGKQLSFYYKGKKIDLGKAPGIQINKVNMLPYYNAIVKNGPKVKRSYNSKTGKLVLTNGSKTITFYKNKKYAYTNGVKRTFTTAPLTVKYRSINKNYILVPAKFTAKYLGISYTYSSSAKRIDYAKPAASNSGGQTSTNTTTNYNTTLKNYIVAQEKKLSTYNKKKIKYENYIPLSTDTTHNYQFLRLDKYRAVNATTFKNLINKYTSSSSILRGKSSVVINSAKSANIDPVYFLCQSVLETGSGTSTLSNGQNLEQVITGASLVKSNKVVTGFVPVSKKEKGKSYVTVGTNAYYEVENFKKKTPNKYYNTYGIKAYDNKAELCGFSYAYYMGWTSVDKSIQGAAKYIGDQYIHSSVYKQNTLYKFRYNPVLANIDHQYATDPAYAVKIATIMYDRYRSAYSPGVVLNFDKPVFK